MPDGLIRTFAGGGSKLFANGIPATEALLGTPSGIAVDKFGNLYISEFGEVSPSC